MGECEGLVRVRVWVISRVSTFLCTRSSVRRGLSLSLRIRIRYCVIFVSLHGCNTPCEGQLGGSQAQAQRGRARPPGAVGGAAPVQAASSSTGALPPSGQPTSNHVPGGGEEGRASPRASGALRRRGSRAEPSGARLAALPTGRLPTGRLPSRVTFERAGLPLLALVLDDLRPVPAQGEAGAELSRVPRVPRVPSSILGGFEPGREAVDAAEGRAARAARGFPAALQRLRLCSAARSRGPSCQSSREALGLLLRSRAANLSLGFGRRLRRCR